MGIRSPSSLILKSPQPPTKVELFAGFIFYTAKQANTVWSECTMGKKDKRKYAANALRKLARALEKLAPRMSEHIKLLADVLDADDRCRALMLSWIRGWGAKVQVMKPESLPNVFKRETERPVQVYKLTEGQIAPVVGVNCLYFAHSKEGLDKTEWQCLKDHLVNTANLAAEFGRDAGVSELARVAGLMHDIGKYSEAFQSRLEGSKRRVDHSTAGAKEIIALFKDQPQKTLANILAYCIVGHHTGLPDYGSKADVEGGGTLLARLDRSKLEDYSAYKTEINPADLHLPERLSIRPIRNYRGKSLPGFSVSFLTRMVYSALVDADYQETETYMHADTKSRGGYVSIEDLCQTFNRYLQKFDNPVGEINKSERRH
ncbi:MAG: CRISPR-associated endonuclease Cas3'' [Chloroflexi bacterium]|nr:CRISPR-associated endonuclease Cas3'' [Chloroflexota bacterium]